MKRQRPVERREGRRSALGWMKRTSAKVNSWILGEAEVEGFVMRANEEAGVTRAGAVFVVIVGLPDEGQPPKHTAMLRVTKLPG